MNRREAIKGVAALVGGTVAVSSWGLLQQSCTGNAEKNGSFSGKEQELMDAICDTLIPDTDIPGAKAAGVAPFVLMMLDECYSEEQRESVVEGLAAIASEAKQQHGASFVQLDADKREQILKAFERDRADFFRLIKQLANKGYYSSQIGATQALAFDFVPGDYHACIPLEKGQRAWAM